MLQPKTINSNLPAKTQLKIMNDNILTLFNAVNTITDSLKNVITAKDFDTVNTKIRVLGQALKSLSNNTSG